MALKEDAPPPNYDEATADGKLPTYQEAMGHVGLGELTPRPEEKRPGFIIRALGVLCSSCLCSICYLILATLPISAIAIGAVYLGQCGMQPKIPIFLIVLGAVGLLNTIINLAKQSSKRVATRLEGAEGGQSATRGGNCAEGFIGVFLFVWIIVGSVWVFGNWSEFNHFRGNAFCASHYDFNNQTRSAVTNYISCCHPTVYLYSFVVLVVTYVLPICICCLCMCLVCCLASCGSD
eukprot:Em0022g278a